MKSLTTFILFLSFSISGFGQADNNCNNPTAAMVLHGNNVRTFVKNGGDMFWDNISLDAAYQVPFVNANSASTIFTAGLVMSGIDAGGNLKTAAQMYGAASGRHDYYPGPLQVPGDLPSTESCAMFDKIWSVKRADIQSHLLDLADNGTLDQPIASVMSWPAAGNPFFAIYNGFELPDNQGYASFFDANADAIYNPMEGDYPLPEQVNHQTIPAQITWTVFNDAGNIHAESQGDPIQAEIQLTTWAFQCDDNDLLNNTIFTRYKISNESAEALDSFHVGFFVDFDLGCYTDDFIGSNPAANSFFTYNQDNIDGEFSGDCPFDVSTFDENPPVQAVTLLNQPLDYFMYFSNAAFDPIPAMSDPAGPLEIFYYLTGRWRTGEPLTQGGDGYQGTEIATHAFPDDPNMLNGWSMTAENLPERDRRVFSSTAIGNFAPNQVITLDYAFSYHREAGASNLGNVSAMYGGIENLQMFYDNQFEEICTIADLCQDDCVWTGDTNADGIANHCDMLPVAVALGATGTSRNLPLNWSPQFSENWSDALPQGTNYKHIDADANQVIEQADFDMSILNYGLTRPDYVANDVYNEGPELSLVPAGNVDIDAFNDGSLAIVRVRLETEEDLYGLAFTLEFDERYIKDVDVLGGDDWFYLVSRSQEIDYVQSKIDGSNTIDNGNFTTLFIMPETTFLEPLPTVYTEFRFKNIKGIRSDGSSVELGGTTLGVNFIDVPTNNKEIEENHFKIYPNPSEGLFYVQSQEETIDKILVFNAFGQTVFQRKQVPTTTFELDLHELSSGIYFIKIQSAARGWIEKVVIE